MNNKPLYENKLYIEDVRAVSMAALPWEKLQDKSIMISGSTGLIGSFLVDVIMEKNTTDDLNCNIYALGRNKIKTMERFGSRIVDNHFIYIMYDVNRPFIRDDIGTVDFVLHLASNTHPMQYATDPIGTITTNIVGLQNMLDFAVDHHTERVVFASSNEIYGENRGDTELFREDYCGYIDSNTLRAGYPESKRCGEALCQAYIKQKEIDIVIPRFTRSYGPTVAMTDTKAINQFIKNCIAKEDIVLKSEGKQYYSYTYVADAVSGLLTVMMKGQNGEAYNIADEKSDITLKGLADILSEINGTKVVFEIPNVVEKAGYSTATKARLSGDKLKKLGWRPMYDIKSGIIRTVNILNSIYQ